jgi:hypothetical protein
MRWLISALVLVVAGCSTSQQRLSDSVYEHTRRAQMLESQGDHDAAEAEWSAAQRDREKLARKEASIVRDTGY